MELEYSDLAKQDLCDTWNVKKAKSKKERVMKSESVKGMNELISEERHRLTLEALADVDAGNVIDRQAIQAWSGSLETDSPLPVPDKRI